ncbi:MAG TPA: MFS transporter [Micromonosporaceae bacterium]|nr:MFS transporter [Micromonosporaceae bacterium]
MVVEQQPAVAGLASREFRWFFTGATASKMGTQIGIVAIPFLATASLGASPAQVGLLVMLSTVAFLLIGLPAGAWVDRLRRRQVQIVADLTRAALIGSIPVAWAMDALRLEQLYLVVFLSGVAAVFFDVAAQSYLPYVVGPAALVPANARLGSVDAASQVAGRSLGGYLIDAFTAPGALVVTAFGYLSSVVSLGFITRKEPQPERPADAHLWREIREGSGFVLRHPILRPIAIAGAGTNFCVHMILTMVVVLFVHGLRVSAGVIGVFLAAGGAGVFLGALTARRIAGRLGTGRTLWLVDLVLGPIAVLIPLVQRGPMLWLATAAWVVVTFRVGVTNVIQISLRQRMTPQRLLGRMNATMRWMLFGAVALGAGTAGLVGEYFGARASLWVGGVGLTLVWLPVFLSPVRRLRESDLDNSGGWA